MGSSDQPAFLADSMLGSLAKKLRLLGIDTAYIRDADDSELKYLVRSQDRILLTRDINLYKNINNPAWFVTGKDVREEFLSIVNRLMPYNDQFKPFSRCLDCNYLILPIEPSEADGKVPPFIYQSKKTFSHCPSCGKVFWEGTHSERMGEEIGWMKRKLEIRGKGEEGK